MKNNNFTKKYNDVILDDLRYLPVFGGINGVFDEVVIPSGDWTKYLVSREAQSSLYFDTWNCVAESATNEIEIIFEFLLQNNLLDEDDLNFLNGEGYIDENGHVNFSARALGALAGTKVLVGNSVGRVSDVIIYQGLIPESKWRFDLRERDPKKNSPEEYYKIPPQELLDLGKKFLERFKIDIQAVWSNAVSEALKKSPLQVLVNAWFLNSEGLYYNPNEKINHAVVRKAINIKDKQIFDTYDPFEKALTEDYYYYPTAFKYTITKKIIKKSMQLQNNQTYLLTEGPEQKYALADNGSLLIADKGQEMFVLLNSAARLGGIGNVKVIPVSLANWNSVPHFNLKKEKID